MAKSLESSVEELTKKIEAATQAAYNYVAGTNGLDSHRGPWPEITRAIQEDLASMRTDALAVFAMPDELIPPSLLSQYRLNKSEALAVMQSGQLS